MEAPAPNDAVPPEQQCDNVSLSAHDEGASPCISDKDLFKPTPKREECPTCFPELPIIEVEIRYQACCGKILCSGCIYATKKAGDVRDLCPFCRALPPESEWELIEKMKERAYGGDAEFC